MQSRVFKGLLRPVLTATAIATAIATYETLREVDQSFSDLALKHRAHACTSWNTFSSLLSYHPNASASERHKDEANRHCSRMHELFRDNLLHF